MLEFLKKAPQKRAGVYQKDIITRPPMAKRG
jgi:hypothetical protein